MRITLLGVGEAFDPTEPNSSALVEQDGFTLLIDCGHSVVDRLWRARANPEAVDAVIITHHHADHVLGLPPVLNRWSWEGRQKPLLILTTQTGSEQIRGFLELLRIETDFPLRYADPADTPNLGPFRLAVAPTQHAVPNRALRLESEGRRFAWSGDGRPTDAARALYSECDLLMHECFEPEVAPNLPTHCDLPTVRSIEGPGRIGLYHVREGCRGLMRDAVAADPRLFVPDTGDVLDL